MNIQRLVLSLAAGALGGAAILYLRKRQANQSPQDPVENESTNDRVSVVREDEERGSTTQSNREHSDSTQEKAAAEANPVQNESTQEHTDATVVEDGLPGGQRELSEFLGGESWFDEIGWQEIWKREGIENPTAWLRQEGLRVLQIERKKLVAHPALLAGCRRRWIVVSRYADIDVAVAAELWNETDD